MTRKPTVFVAAIRPGLPYLLLGVLLCTDVSSYLFEKIACNHAAGAGTPFLLAMLRQPFLWGSLALGPLQLFLWTRILGRCDLSKAYPISGLNMPLTLMAATILLGEQLSWQVWTGAALITLGGAIIGPGPGRMQQMPGTPPA
jgi:drug/metabolite transporter (DMT)-like permease